MAVINQVGNALTGATGTGKFVGDTSPTLVTPDIGTPSAGVLTNATGLPVAGLANGTDGELITWDASGNPATVGVGTAAQVLTSNGPGAAPTFQDAAAGGTITDWVAYTPTFVGFGTPSDVQIWSRRVGDTLEVRGRFVSGTSTAVEARINLGFNGTDGNVSSSATKITDIQLTGYLTGDLGSASDFLMLIESNVGYMTIGVQNATNSGLLKRNGNILMSSGDDASFFAAIPIDTWP